MANDTPKPDYSSARPTLNAPATDDKISLVNQGALAAYAYVLDSDPRFVNNKRLQTMMRSKEVSPHVTNYLTAVTDGVAPPPKKKKHAEQDQDAALSLAGGVAGIYGTKKFSDSIFNLATHLDNPMARKQLLGQMSDVYDQYKADKGLLGVAKTAETEAKLAREASSVLTKDGVKVAEREAGVIAKYAMKFGKLGAKFGKYAAIGGPAGALVGFGMTALGAGVVFATMYATTGDMKQSAHDAANTVCPIDAIEALCKGDLNRSAAKMTDYFVPGTEGVAHFALHKLNPKNEAGMYLHTAERLGKVALNTTVRAGERLVGMTPESA
jgi:hypothetical protein